MSEMEKETTKIYMPINQLRTYITYLKKTKNKKIK